MRQEYFDRALAAEEEIVPSTHFTSGVMEAVLREASAPLPIPFPWKRALPGLMLAGLAVVVLVFVPVPTKNPGVAGPSATQVTAMLAPLLETMRRFSVNWLGAALLLAWACMKLSMRLASPDEVEVN